jgi:acetyltransferase-like isoleucine patch superfamily enzyme
VQDCVAIELGRDCSIDPGVILGYPPGRPVERYPVRIGDNARIRSGSVVYASVVVGSGFETGHNVVIREGNRIGNDCAIWNHTTVDYDCVLGNRVRIHCNVYVSQYTTIEDDVFLAPGVMLANDPHPICTKCMQGPTIRAGARIGIRATILPHIIIGENALVGAGSVVTRDVPPHAVVAGSPARVIGGVDELECPFDIVKPYENGIDVRRRPEWAAIAPLPHPVIRPDRSRKP